MLLDVERKKVRKIFLWEKYIQEAVDDARAKSVVPKHCKNALGYDDPTCVIVVRKNSLIKRVGFNLPNGKRIVLANPEKWLQIIQDTYEMYEGQIISAMIRARAKDNRKSPEVLADFNCIGLNTYYRWEREFLDDAALLAAERGILRQKK